MNSTLSTLEQRFVLKYAVIAAGWVGPESIQQYPCWVPNRVPGIDLAWRVPEANHVRTILVEYKYKGPAEMFCYKSTILNQHNSPCPIRQIYHCTNIVLFVLISHRSNHEDSIISLVGTPQEGRQILPYQVIQPSPNTMTSNPTCLDCGTPGKTCRRLAINRKQCPKRQIRTVPIQKGYRSNPQSEKEGSASNWHSGDETPSVDHKFYSGSSTSLV